MGASVDSMQIAQALSAYPAEARRAADAWHKERYLHWVDAVCWVATRSVPLLKLLRAHRSLMATGLRNPKDGPSVWLIQPRSAQRINAECAILSSDHIADKAALDAAGELLRQALEAGTIEGIGIDAKAGGKPTRIEGHAWSSSSAFVPARSGSAVVLNEKGDLIFEAVKVCAAHLLNVWPDEAVAAPKQGRKPTFDWESFERAAIERLEDEGDFFGEFRKSDLEREMADWCQSQQWPRVPSESLIRDHITKAHEAFLRGRAEK